MLSLAAVLAIVAVPGYLQIARSQQAATAPAASAATRHREPLPSAPSSTSIASPATTSGCKPLDCSLDKLDPAHMHDHAEIWEKVVRKLRAGMMPPAGNAAAGCAGARIHDLFHGEGTRSRRAPPNLTPPGLHRLNRTEYTNAIRDVLALEVDATKFLPPDDSTHGFDNIAGALTLSPALMEAYLSAAGKISRLAIGDVSAPTQAVFEVPADTAQNYHIEGLPFGTRGGILIKYQFPADGEYTFKVKGVTGYFQAVLGGVKGEQLEVTVDGERVKLFDWDKEIANTTGNGKSTPAHPGQGRPAHRRRDVPGHQRRAGQRTEQAVSADHEHARAPYRDSCSIRTSARFGLKAPTMPTGASDTASPPEDFRVPPGHAPRTKPRARAPSLRRS